MEEKKTTVERVTPMRLEFVRKAWICKNLLRVTLTGEDLRGFPDNQNGSHIKVFFPNQQSGILQLPVRHGEEVIWPEHKPVARAYSVRQYRAADNELDIDFVTHGTATPGGGWALKATRGSTIGLIGPSGPEPLLAPADWHVLAGDLSAVPAISAILETLPSDSIGYVYLEVEDEADIHPIQAPVGIEITWFVHQADAEQPVLASAIEALSNRPKLGTLSVFVAGENESVVACRKILKNQFKLEKKAIYAIPYWKRGKTEEAYHAERHEVMDSEY